MRLGWAFVSKARISSDPGYYKLAEICAQSVTDADDSDALLLRGHIAHSPSQVRRCRSDCAQIDRRAARALGVIRVARDAQMEQGSLKRQSRHISA